ISLFTALYTYSGGISTVIWTDLLQSAVLIIGSIAIFVLLLMQINSGDTVSPEHLNIINLDFDFGVDTTLWAGVVAVSFLHLSVYG
ncbi:sodium:solute symporter, partial [Vibrio sp. 10N.222.55.E8]